MDRDPHGQRPPWTETPMDRDPLDRDPHGQRHFWIETLLDRDLLGQRPSWTETPGRNMGPGSQTGSEIIQRLLE